MMNRGNLICIIGVDGVGKTSHAKRLVNAFENNGVKSIYIWFRFHHFLSLPLLAYCRISGLTWYKDCRGFKIGKHEFYKSKFVSFLYPWLLFIDTLLACFHKIYLPLYLNYTVVCDRFIYDTIVDLIIDTQEKNFCNKNVAKMFMRLFPKNTKTILLELNEPLLRARRKDLELDCTLSERAKLYHNLSIIFDIPRVDNSAEFDKASREIQKILKFNGNVSI